MFRELNSLNKSPWLDVDDHLLLTLTHYQKWLKVDTSQKAIDIILPITLPVGFYAIVENTGPNRVNFKLSTNATYEGIFDYIGQQNGGVHILYEGGQNNTWRSHGLQGELTLDSLSDVFANKQVLQQTPGNKIFTYVPGSGFVFLPDVPYSIPKNINTNYAIDPKDHGKEFLVDTTSGQIDIFVTHTTDTGIIPGWTGRFKNIGSNKVFFDTVSGNNFVGSNSHYLQPGRHIDLRYLDEAQWVYYGDLTDV